MTNWRERFYNWLEWLLDLLFNGWDDLMCPADQDSISMWSYVAKQTLNDGHRRWLNYTPGEAQSKALWIVRKAYPEVVVYVLPDSPEHFLVFERRTEYDAHWEAKS